VGISATSGHGFRRHPGKRSGDIRAPNPATSGHGIRQHPGRSSGDIRARIPVTSGQ